MLSGIELSFQIRGVSTSKVKLEILLLLFRFAVTSLRGSQSRGFYQIPLLHLPLRASLVKRDGTKTGWDGTGRSKKKRTAHKNKNPSQNGCVPKEICNSDLLANGTKTGRGQTGPNGTGRTTSSRLTRLLRTRTIVIIRTT